MQLVINGQNKEIAATATVADLVGQFCKNKQHIIAELNGTIIPISDWSTTVLKQGDALELVAFVGGG